MSPEQLEFAITQYLDGTLPERDAEAVREALANDPAARAMLEEHEKLTAVLRSVPVPELKWEELAADFSAVVTGSVDERSRALDQKLNGVLKAGAAPLPEIAWEALSRQISAAVDAAISRADSEDQKLDAVLRSAPAPNLNWEKLAGHLSRVVADEAKEVERPAVMGRIGWVRRVSQFAVAACVLLAAAVGIRSYLHRGGPPQLTGTGPKPAAVAIVETPVAEKASEPAVAEVSIGPSKAYAAASDDEVYRRGVAANRSPVVIATPVDVNEDSDRGLMFE